MIRPFEPSGERDRAALAEEGTRLLAFVAAANAEATEARFARW